MNRTTFVKTTALGTLSGLLLPNAAFANELSTTKDTKFFKLQQNGNCWWLIDPSGKPFFSLGLNHVDPSALGYSENKRIWQEKYGNSMQKWLQNSVKPRLTDWGFNTLGWNREVATRGETIHRHSRAFTFEEYQWLDMPYCHQLPFAEFHQWEAETKHPNFFSQEFIDWCDFVAREHCVPMANDPKLIGYFYIDCPTWLHTRPKNEWKGPLFDPKRLDSRTGKDELFALATQWYKVTHDAIRRYDKNHLILGDRYEANAPLTMEIINAAKAYVDVLSFQDFKKPVAHLNYWHKQSDMPVLWADGAHSKKIPNSIYKRNDGQWYAEIVTELVKNPACIGAHLCGAFIRNKVRRKGLVDENDNADEEMISYIREANQKVTDWFNKRKI